MTGRSSNKLTDLKVRKTTAVGWYGDGLGLYLRVQAGGAKSWVFVFFWMKDRKEMGLGAPPETTLAAARDKRDAARKLVQAGKNPIEERRRERERMETGDRKMTFGDYAALVAPSVGPKAPLAQKAWIRSMQDKVGKLADLLPANVMTEDVLAAIKPYWTSRPETGKRLRQRIERVLDAAKAQGLIDDPWVNPARLKGHLENLLPKRSTKVQHRAALPYTAAPAFWADLAQLDSVSAHALKWTTLTLARTIETIGATWSEIHEAEGLWIVPPARMKGPVELRREHRVPLTDQMLEILNGVRHLRSATKAGYVFPSLSPGKGKKLGKLSDAAMQRVLDDMGRKGTMTVHGLRSTFKDWAEDTTDFSNGVIEAALAHLVGDETERAYRRSDALQKRRDLMEAWCAYLSGGTAA